jgi:RHS repeat-associated protein
VYTYDANGNLTGTTAGQSFTYDAFNRMTQAVGTGGTATYTYNGNGLKIQRVGPDGTTRYYYDGFRPIWETDGIGTMTAQLDRDIFGNLLSRLDSLGTRRYYHTDGLGSTIVLTDATGSFAAGMLYDAWGNVRATSADVGKYRFAGAEMDTASGLYHMGPRFYDPSIGRWFGEDPVQNASFNPLTLNFYAYVFNNPMLLTDPEGTRVVENENGVPSDPISEAELASGVERTPTGPWEQYVEPALAASKKYGVRVELILAIMARESGFDPNAINPVSPDWGIMQVNIHTATDYGIPLGLESRRLFNPRTNIFVGTQHLASLISHFGGNEARAIAAYNLGERAVRNGAVNPGYVNDVQAYERWFRNRLCRGTC